MIPVVHYKEYYLTTKDSITIPFIIQKLVDHPFELLKENKSLGRNPQEKKVYSIQAPFYQVCSTSPNNFHLQSTYMYFEI